ncbi:MAG: PQQ-dependent sugar dehydrogenase [Acidobacteria bacterium]|nr:PQQ-dependent sugar dehydrogenase [Acidobacteriota bacterium]
MSSLHRSSFLLHRLVALCVYYTATTPAIHNRVSRFTASASNPDVVEAGSELALLDLENLSATNHNGGALHFGADGKLYM